MLSYTPERLAWITLLVAQGICLLLTAFGVALGYWFFFDSRVNLQTTLHVGRGTVIVLNRNDDEAVRVDRRMTAGERVTTDEIAQGTLTFVDTHNDDQAVASVIIKSGSQMRMGDATRSRFDFTDQSYSIILDDLTGVFEIHVPEGLAHPVQLVAYGTYGEIRITEPGYFILSSLPNTNMTLLARDGMAAIKPYGGNLTRVPLQHTAVVSPFQHLEQIALLTEDLTPNPLLVNQDRNETPDEWGCYGGGYSTTRRDGRYVLHIQREGDSNFAIGCLQFLGQDQRGIDVTGYRQLRVRATLEVISQELTLCGEEASECPLMLKLSYETASTPEVDCQKTSGGEQEWFNGFYAFEYQGIPVNRTTCASCLSEHIKTVPGNWYTFESPNLLELSNTPEFDRRPVRLCRIEFYASGHSYEVNVSEVSIIGER